MLKKYKTPIIFFYVLCACLLVAGAIWDLKLDMFLNNPDSPFAIWFRNTGEMPARLLVPLAGAVLYAFGDKKLVRIAGAVIVLGGSIHLGCHIGRYFYVEANRIPFSVINGIICGLCLLLVAPYIRVTDKQKKALLVLAVAGLAAFVAETALIESIKIFWGRTRFRDLLLMPNFDDFTPWYHPNGITGNKSFPSGHTASAALSFLALLLPCVSSHCKKHRDLCFWVPFIYTGVVAFTRLIMGAHFLSDVTVGGTISFTVVIVTMKVLENKKPSLLCE